MAAASKNSFGARETLAAGNHGYEIYRLDALESAGIGHVGQLPFSMRVLLENLLRHGGRALRAPADIEALAEWQPVAADARGDCLHARARAAAGFHRRAGAWPTWRRCATPSRAWAATPRRSIPCCRPSW